MHKAAVLVAPALPPNALAVFKLLTSVQEVPSYCSVLLTASGFAPPNAKPAVCVQAPINAALAVFKLPPDDHELPKVLLRIRKP